jgi:Bacterial TSP3 repeat
LTDKIIFSSLLNIDAAIEGHFYLNHQRYTMITSHKIPAIIMGIVSASTFLTAEPLPEQMTFVRTAAGVASSDWAGVPKRTYFYQSSPDLLNWTFAPWMAFGNGGHHYDLSTPGTKKLFVRLKYVDDTAVTTLQQARDADFDNDGISNAYELEALFSDPLNKNSAGGDSDLDGLPDGWEKFYFGGIASNNGSSILQPDGLTNQEKADLGLNPNTDYSSASAPQPASYTYDLTGRLTGVTAPVGGGNYTPDEEGNLLNAQ